MARILVTGARGFIGAHLAQAFANDGHEVVALGHGSWNDEQARSAGISIWRDGDVAVADLRILHARCGPPDSIVHLAGGSSVGASFVDPRGDFERTVTSAAELLDWMRTDAPRAKLLTVSSAAVYGAGHKGAISEKDPLRPYSPYGHHKHMVEELCRSYAAGFGLRVCVARLFSVFGPGLRKQLLWDLCSRLSEGASPLPLGGRGDELRDWTDVRDVSRALSLLLGQASIEVPVFNVGTGVGTSVREVAELVTRAYSCSDHDRTPLKFSGESRAGDPFSLVADPSQLEALGFGFRIPLGAGIRNYVEWFRNQARLGAILP